MSMQSEMQRHFDMVRGLDEPPETPFGGRPYFSNLSLENTPVSPRQMAQDDPRRPSQQHMPGPTRNNYYRPPVQSNLSIAAPPRRYGSIGAGPAQSSPLRAQPPAQPPAPYPVPTHMSSPPMGRRHTSADIRMNNWPGNQQQYSPFASGHNSSAYPSSPKRGPVTINEEQQHIRESFSNYSLSAKSRSRPATPPATNGNSVDHFNQFSFSGGPRDRGATNLFRDTSGPPTRRGSMAHILNPPELAERDEEHAEEMREEDRKRKRVQ